MAASTMTSPASETAEARAVAAARAIALEVVEAKGHGHAGTAMGLAPLAHVLYQRVLRHDPAVPDWPGRDRLILSAGHASLLLYTQLYLTGYGLRLDELAAARTLASPRTPGHPELGHTPGVEMSTGPLGQGVAAAVGLAAALRRESAELDALGAEGLFDRTVWVIAGDGCLQEGVSGEAASLAGSLGIENLVVLWDDNRITIDGPTAIAFAEDVRARYRAYGWRVLELEDLDDLDAIEAVLASARERRGAPTLVAVRSVIGTPSPNRAGTPAAHAGAFGAEEAAAVKRLLGYPEDASLEQLVDEALLAHTRQAGARGAALRTRWQAALTAKEAASPPLAAARAVLHDPASKTARGLAALEALPLPESGAQVATRSANGAVLRALHAEGLLWGGSADLSESTSVAVPGEPLAPDRPVGAFVPFGIREHAMAAFLNGVALHGGWRPYGSTYLAFSDYLRPALRLAALMELPVIGVFSHDSVAVGEDGPTHQPVEQTAGLRTVPGVAVLRPADAAEVQAIWRRLVTEAHGPAALILSRQALPVLSLGEDGALPPAERGGYVLRRFGSGDELAIIATGSEVQLALAAAAALAAEQIGVRVVSMPSVEWFEAEPAEYRESVLPGGLRARVVVEAGRTAGWWRIAGLDGAVIGVDGFGISGSGAEVLEHYGITADGVIAAARRVIARDGRD